MASEFARGKAAQAWCKRSTEHLVMDPTLAEAFAEIIDELTTQPWLGNATTRELIAEISARSNLDYKTVSVS